MDCAVAPIERRGRRDYAPRLRQNMHVFDRIACWRANVVAVTRIMMVRNVLIRIRRHLIDVASGMDRELHPREASPRPVGGMGHARETGQGQHKARQEGKTSSHG